MHFKFSIIAFCFLVGGAIGCGRNVSPVVANASQTDFALEFQNEFGFAPPADAADGSTKSVRVGDTLSRWFSFDYRSNIFQRITNQNFATATSEEMRRPWEALWSQNLVI